MIYNSIEKVKVYRVNYCLNIFDVYVDGAGLDIGSPEIAGKDFNDSVYSSIGQDLFSRIFDADYSKIGLRNAIKKAGAKIEKTFTA